MTMEEEEEAVVVVAVIEDVVEDVDFQQFSFQWWISRQLFLTTSGTGRGNSVEWIFPLLGC